MTTGRNPTKRVMKKARSAARSVAETTLDVAVGGTALAVDKAAEAAEEVVERAEEVIRRGRREVRTRSGQARRVARKAVADQDSRPYEERTRDELYALAAEREIEGRSSMRKRELIAALRAER